MHPAPGSAEELSRFAELQRRLVPLYERIFPDPRAPRTVVVNPSLSLNPDILAKIAGVQHYEERMLCMLMLLRLPRTRVVFLSSQPVHPTILDYYLHLLPGIPAGHARKRLTVLSADDASITPLTQKILAKPQLLQRIRQVVDDPTNAHMTCFNATAFERTLAVQLGLPLYACDPALTELGTKTGSRRVFKEAGIEMPPGFEGLRDEGDMVEALEALKAMQPYLRRAAVKLNDGTSGEGNAVFSFEGSPRGNALRGWIERELPRRLRFEEATERWEPFRDKFTRMTGVVESWIEGEKKRSPSVQGRIDPLGEVQLVSTHDQLLGGPSQQIYLGATFPADEAYRFVVQRAGMRVGEVLKAKGVLGRYGVDFVSVDEGGEWKHYAIEINLRKGGTTHPYLMLQFLTDGVYHAETGLYKTSGGQVRTYYTSDNLGSPSYKGLTPDDLIDISAYHSLHFHGASQQGVVFHLIGALSEYGKVGVLCVADSIDAALKQYGYTVEVLNREARKRLLGDNEA
jgi:hypothetical protein